STPSKSPLPRLRPWAEIASLRSCFTLWPQDRYARHANSNNRRPPLLGVSARIVSSATSSRRRTVRHKSAMRTTGLWVAGSKSTQPDPIRNRLRIERTGEPRDSWTKQTYYPHRPTRTALWVRLNAKRRIRSRKRPETPAGHPHLSPPVNSAGPAPRRSGCDAACKDRVGLPDSARRSSARLDVLGVTTCTLRTPPLLVISPPSLSHDEVVRVRFPISAPLPRLRLPILSSAVDSVSPLFDLVPAPGGCFV
ncbi:hypothetical protein BHM03_00030413, partial [Ensete ventricosum]